jgi:hypothetical protein
MEMSTFHHHLWYVRSRFGAWDHPRRAQKQFIDLHVAANASSQRVFLPANLGWWAVKHWVGAQEERTFPDDIEYLCGKALGTDSGLSLMGIDPKNAAGMSNLAGIFKRYESLRLSRQVSDSIKKKPVCRVRNSGSWISRRRLGVLPGPLQSTQVEALTARPAVGRSQTFGPQPMKLRIEPLMAAGRWDADTNIVLTDAGTVAMLLTAPPLRACPRNSPSPATSAIGRAKLRFTPPMPQAWRAEHGRRSNGPLRHRSIWRAGKDWAFRLKGTARVRF